MSRRLVVVAVALCAFGFSAPARAQEEKETAKPEATPRAKRPAAGEDAPDDVRQQGRRPVSGVTATLRVQMVLSRLQGEKKAGSLPYTFVATAGGDRVRMRMGVDTPVPIGPGSGSQPDALKMGQSFQYKNVGTNIDCVARDLGDGLYQLSLTVENSAAMMGVGARDSATGAPLFRKFETTINPVLRDGQSIQAIASTDPVSGEVVKIDVTMNVVK